jgi:chromosome partitioning protein
MKVIALYNIKGGVGKTASAVNLAYLASRSGANTLIWDLDPQAAATYYLRTKPKVKGGAKGLIKKKYDLDTLIRGTEYDNLDLLPADFSYRNLSLILDRQKKSGKQIDRLVRPLAQTYSHLFIDCPAGISLISENVFRAIDVLLIPLIPTTLSLHTLKQIESYLVRNILPKKRLQVITFFCMFDRRKKLHRDIYAQATENMATQMLRTAIPYASMVEQMGLYRAPLPVYSRKSLPAMAYEHLWSELLACMGSADI